MTGGVQIIALDLSLTGTGIAALHRDGHVSVRTVATRNPGHDHNGWTAPGRHKQITMAIAGLVGPETVAAKEDRLMGEVKGNSFLDLAGLHAVVDYVLYACRVPIARINLMHVKQFAAGKGSADKDAMMGAARQHLSDYVDVFNDNEADALWVLAMACLKYRIPLWTPPVHRACKVDKVVWPMWSPPDGASGPVQRQREGR